MLYNCLWCPNSKQNEWAGWCAGSSEFAMHSITKNMMQCNMSDGLISYTPVIDAKLDVPIE